MGALMDVSHERLHELMEGGKLRCPACQRYHMGEQFYRSCCDAHMSDGSEGERQHMQQRMKFLARRLAAGIV